MDIAKPDHATPSCGIAIMAKASVPGRAKTRLVPPLTFAEAAAFNSAFLKDVAANVLAAADGADIAGYVAFGPPGADAVAFFQRLLPRRIGLIEAWFPNFGDCLFSAVAQLLDRGHASAVVLNSDSPTLPTSLLVETARVLASRATAPSSAPRSTAATICSASSSRIGACSRTSPGAPSRWPAKPWSARPRSACASMSCRPGTTSTTSRR